MKKLLVFLIIAMCLLCGCSKNEQIMPDAAEPPPEPTDSAAPQVTMPLGTPVVILAAFSDDITDEITETILDDYAEFDALPKSEQMKKQGGLNPIGQYRADFNTWSEFEEYFGIIVPNVLQEYDIIDENSFSKGVHCLWRGERDGSISWMTVDSQYTVGGTDVNYHLTINMAKSDYEYEISTLNGIIYEVISEPFEIFTYKEKSDSYRSSAIFAKENILYGIDVFASNDNEEEVKETFEYILSRIVA